MNFFLSKIYFSYDINPYCKTKISSFFAVLKSLLHKYPILFLEYWLESKQYRISYFQVSFILQTQSCVLLPSNPFLPSKNERIATLSLSLKKKKEEEEEKRKHMQNKKISNFILLKKVLCLECSTCWNTCIHNFLIYPVEGNKKGKRQHCINGVIW